MPDLRYKRILLKLSGEILAGKNGFGIDPEKASYLANEIKSIYELGLDLGLIIGAGNIFRGMEAASRGMDRVTGDYLGMLATIMNAISMQDALEKVNCQTRTLSAIDVKQISEPYIRRRAIRHIEKGRIVIFAAGTGNPYFTTDTAAALRASEMKCDVIFKATKVDGIYDSDPVSNEKAKKFKNISYDEVIKNDLKIMDTASISLSRENKISIIVFSLLEENSLIKVSNGKGNFTIIS